MHVEINEEGVNDLMQTIANRVSEEYQKTADKVFLTMRDASISDIVAEFEKTANTLGIDPEITALENWAKIIKSGRQLNFHSGTPED